MRNLYTCYTPFFEIDSIFPSNYITFHITYKIFISGKEEKESMVSIPF